MMKIQFPQINRKLTALFYLLVFIFLVGVNFWQNSFFKTNYEKTLRFSLLKNPSSGFLHEKLGQYFWGKDDKRAEKEFLLAQEYHNILGSQSPPWQTWLNFIGKKKNLDAELSYWEKVGNTYPNFLYADLKLATLNLQKGESIKAKNHLENILLKDPTYKLASQILKRIK